MEKETPARTSRLEFTRIAESDREWLIQLYRSPEVMRFIFPGGFPPERAEKSFARALEKNEDVAVGQWAIRSIETGERVGLFLTMKFERDPKWSGIEVGYLIEPAHWGKGMASEAVASVVDFVFRSGKHTHLLAMIENGHVESERVISKVGFMKEPGTLEKYPNCSVWKLRGESLPLQR